MGVVRVFPDSSCLVGLYLLFTYPAPTDYQPERRYSGSIRDFCVRAALTITEGRCNGSDPWRP